MNPGWPKSFLELSKSYDININELNDPVSYSWAARPVSYNLLHYPRKRDRREGRKEKKKIYFKIQHLATLIGKHPKNVVGEEGMVCPNLLPIQILPTHQVLSRVLLQSLAQVNGGSRMCTRMRAHIHTL